MATRYFHWDAIDDCVMHETDDAGATTVEYTHEPGQFGPLLSETRSGVESYHHYDALGSTTALSDPTGALTDTFQYDAWGNQVLRTGTTPTPYTWVGRWGYQQDTPTGGYYIRARSYQPMVARWMSVDPMGFMYTSNLFEYGLSCPLIFIDPSGLRLTIVPRPAPGGRTTIIPRSGRDVPTPRRDRDRGPRRRPRRERPPQPLDLPPDYPPPFPLPYPSPIPQPTQHLCCDKPPLSEMFPDKCGDTLVNNDVDMNYFDAASRRDLVRQTLFIRSQGDLVFGEIGGPDVLQYNRYDRPTTRDCRGQGSFHTNVYYTEIGNQDDQFGSVLCCTCCNPTQPAPEIRIKCKFNEGKEYIRIYRIVMADYTE